MGTFLNHRAIVLRIIFERCFKITRVGSLFSPWTTANPCSYRQGIRPTARPVTAELYPIDLTDLARFPTGDTYIWIENSPKVSARTNVPLWRYGTCNLRYWGTFWRVFQSHISVECEFQTSSVSWSWYSFPVYTTDYELSSSTIERVLTVAEDMYWLTMLYDQISLKE